MTSTQYTLVQHELKTVFDIMRDEATDFDDDFGVGAAWWFRSMKENRVDERACRAIEREIELEMRRDDRRDRERGRWF